MMDRLRGLPGRLAAVEARRFWPAVVVLAALMRLACLIWWERGNYSQVFGYDPYITFAKSWLGWVAPMKDVTHPPVYTLWVSAVFLLLGRPWLLAVQVLNAAFGVALCVLAGLWGERAVSKSAGRLGALWCAVDPLLVFFSVQLQSEPFFLLLEMLFFLLLLRVRRTQRPWALLGLGVFAGVITLTRSAFAFYPFYLAAAMFLASRFRPRSLVWLLVAAGWALPLTLWGARNQMKYGEFVPMTSNGGWTLWEGFTLDREEVRRRPALMNAELEREGVDVNATLTAGSDYFMAKWKRYVREDPVRAAGIVAGKALLFWRPWPYDPHGRAARAAVGAYFCLLFLAAGLGLWRLRGRWMELAPVLALFIYLTMLHSVFFTSLRYRSPLEPFLCLLAAAGACALLERKT